VVSLLLTALLLSGAACGEKAVNNPQPSINLPPPHTDGAVALEQVLLQRRSRRELSSASLTLQEVSQLLWAAQGVTDSKGYRTAPSAGALYPLELFLVTGQVEGLEAGIYRYQPTKHRLLLEKRGDLRKPLASAALSQESIRDNAAVLVFTAVYSRTTGKYGQRGIRYVHIEVGHAAQNLYLQATVLGIGTVMVGAFHDLEVQKALGLREDEQPLALMPLGRELR
jgi:SagB-type dehydrogenase family enzyme